MQSILVFLDKQKLLVSGEEILISEMLFFGSPASKM